MRHDFALGHNDYADHAGRNRTLCHWGNAAPAQPSAAQRARDNYMANIGVRNLIVHGSPENGVPPAVDMWQPLNPPLPSTVTTGTSLQCQLRNVGLIKRLLVKITGTITAGATSLQTRTPMGLANLVSNFLFTDLANNQRINSTGWHLVGLSTSKRRRPWGAAATTDTPLGYGNNYSAISLASTIAATVAANFTAFFEVPFVRNDHDLRGLIFGDVTTANALLQVTLNPNMFVTSTGDPTSAVFQSAGTDLCTISAVAWQVYQNYLDQYPRMQDGTPILPALDIGTAYVLTQTSSTLPVANQDNSIPFVNQRQFMSLMAIYDNAGVLNAGTDITNFAITSANFTNIRYLDPIAQALLGRNLAFADFPKGSYFFDFSDRPIDTAQYGNMMFVAKPSSVGGASAVFLLGWEAFGTIGLINQGGSIPSGA